MFDDHVRAMNDHAALYKYCARRATGSSDPGDLILFIMSEFRVDSRTAETIPGGDTLFLLEMLHLWRTEPPETRRLVIESVEEFRGWRRKNLEDPDITDEVRGHIEAFLEASTRGGLWLDGAKLSQRAELRAPEDAARNRFAYEQKAEGVGWKAIVAKINATEGWGDVNPKNGGQYCAKTHQLDWGLPWPPKKPAQ